MSSWFPFCFCCHVCCLFVPLSLSLTHPSILSAPHSPRTCSFSSATHHQTPCPPVIVHLIPPVHLGFLVSLSYRAPCEIHYGIWNTVGVCSCGFVGWCRGKYTSPVTLSLSTEGLDSKFGVEWTVLVHGSLTCKYLHSVPVTYKPNTVSTCLMFKILNKKYCFGCVNPLQVFNP